ncbi:MAG: hypothetical protein K1X75_05805 [Leptospirales bacterium]|nr:hypothetical protein [Leptospirales bacterium]
MITLYVGVRTPEKKLALAGPYGDWNQMATSKAKAVKLKHRKRVQRLKQLRRELRNKKAG